MQCKDFDECNVRIETMERGCYANICFKTREEATDKPDPSGSTETSCSATPGLEVHFLKQRIEELEATLKHAQMATSTAAMNAVTAYDDGDETLMLEILHAIAGE